MANYSLQQLLQTHLPRFLKQHSLPLYQHRALQSIVRCRTAALGGHVQSCEQGHINGVWYNSCKCRACPQCRAMPTQEWLSNTQSALIECSHHHIVFTLPHELHDLWRFNRALLSDFLFKATMETLKLFSADTRYLGATAGILLAQHTWGRDLALHPHIHALVTHGGLNADNKWVTPKKKTLFPYEPVRQIFRGKFLDFCRKALNAENIVLPTGRDKTHIKTLLNRLGRSYWHVYFSERYDSAVGVAKYLARYVKGGPINKGQLKASDSGGIIFSYTSHKTQKKEQLHLSVDAFLQRWLQHVPMPGKPLVRYGGLYSAAIRARLNSARKVHGQTVVSERVLLDWQAYMSQRNDLPVCDQCGCALRHGAVIKPRRVA
ncbi:MAG: IS91 family transposase [Marinagarivorans sp.]|nr:IS91 family transposase [Marinagarivorans sp.]